MKVLIIQQKMIGDVLTSTILFEAIKKKYPKSELHYLINSHTYPVVKGNPYIDKFQFFTKEHEKSISALLILAKSLQSEHYEVVIDIYSKISSNIISLYSKAKTRISKRKWYTCFLYTETIIEHKIPKTNAGLAIENRINLLSPLKIKTEVLRPKIYLTKGEIQDGKTIMEANGLDLSKPIFMIGVLGSGKNKTYPLYYMANILDTIINQIKDAQLLFNYIPKQTDDAKSVFNLCKEKTQNQIFLNVYGNSLRQFLMLTANSLALIGNEGGATNMAKALNIPTFTIFSPWINKNSWNMFDDGVKHISVHLKDYFDKPYKGITHPKELKSKTEELYQEFSPNLFKPKLEEFLTNLLI